MYTIPERITALEGKTEELEKDSSELAKAVKDLNDLLHEGKGAVKLFLWVCGLLGSTSVGAWIYSHFGK